MITNSIVELFDVNVSLLVFVFFVDAQPLNLDLLRGSVNVLVSLAQKIAALVISNGQIFAPENKRSISSIKY
jgi:hypothetical protein